MLLFGFSTDALNKSVPNRVGQCVMTCPTTAVYDGLPTAETHMPLGKKIRFFGDGYQKSKQVAGRRYWRIPVMDGEFLVDDVVGVEKGVAGGNLILQVGRSAGGAGGRAAGDGSDLAAPGVITPFPGGSRRSGSKVGSRYKGLVASTSDAYCPTLRGRVESKLHKDANCAYEIVIDGTSEQAVGNAMAAGLRAAAGSGVVAITAGNYGGKLGKYQFHLRKLLGRSRAAWASRRSTGSVREYHSTEHGHERLPQTALSSLLIALPLAVVRGSLPCCSPPSHIFPRGRCVSIAASSTCLRPTTRCCPLISG